LLVALAVWSVLLAGQPETALNDLLFGALFGLVRLAARPAGRARLAARWAAAALLAASAAPPMLLPAWDYLGQSHRDHRLALRNEELEKHGWLAGFRTPAERA